MRERLFRNWGFRIGVMIVSFLLLWIANHGGGVVFSLLSTLGFGFMVFLAWFK